MDSASHALGDRGETRTQTGQIHKGGHEGGHLDVGASDEGGDEGFDRGQSRKVQERRGWRRGLAVRLKRGHLVLAADDLRCLKRQMLDHLAADGGTAELLEGLAVGFQLHGVVVVNEDEDEDENKGEDAGRWPLIDANTRKDRHNGLCTSQ